MADSNDSDPKKAFPNSFLFFLIAAVLVVLMVQAFIDTKFANVSFSYQLEHLVNLKLIRPEDSRKTALSDNLVTFSGRFRETRPEESKERFKYLELLNSQHQLLRQKGELEGDLQALRLKIADSVDWYLLLSGRPISSSGYTVVADVYDRPGESNSMVVREVSRKDVDSISDLDRAFDRLRADDDASDIAAFGRRLSTFMEHMRSPLLGIGNESMKQKLKAIDAQLLSSAGESTVLSERLVIYSTALNELRQILDDLHVSQDGVRLSKLRTVRNYKEALNDYHLNAINLNDDEIRLEKARSAVTEVIWFFNGQELSTRALERQDAESYHQWFVHCNEEWEAFPSNKGAVFKAPDQPLNLVLQKKFKSEQPASNYLGYLFNFLPVLLVVLVLYFIFSRQMKGMGNNAMSFGKSPAKLLQTGDHKVTFQDVAGLEEALEELEEIVEFLKEPQKFTALGGRIPKGVLCIGPPGTGKTLIARAVAGEADRPFFSISGSDFVEMFVGVGASRIRDMFEQAKKQAPCIIFIDEIDAVGRHRGAGIGGGHDEREQTLNQLLVEMDGFDSNEGVILMAATNRPDVLDKALLRPGRFDRHVVLNLPDIKGRFEVLKVHARKIKLDEGVELMDVARATPGCSGADLENILNEAALLAARKSRTAVTQSDVTEARDKVIYGKERRSMEMDESERKTTAYHESGHAIVGLYVEHSDPVDKVTIIPRGMSLGATMFLPQKNRTSYWKKEIHDQLAVLMGGRVAEEIFVGDMSSGAQQDIERATELARSMVCQWGMSDKLGAVAYDERNSDSGQYLGIRSGSDKRYSETTAKIIDDEVHDIIDQAHAFATKLVKRHRKKVQLMTDMLMEFETLDSEDVQRIMDGEWDAEEKRGRLRKQAEASKAAIPPPPSAVQDEAGKESSDSILPKKGRRVNAEG